MRTIQFLVNDGSDDSIPVTKNINIIPINDSPVLTSSSQVMDYAAGTGSQVINPSLIVTDVDNLALANATIAIVGNFNPTQDKLHFVNQHSIVGDYNNVLGILSLTGLSNIEYYQLALQDVTYENSAVMPNITDRVIAFTVCDGEANSNTVTSAIHIAYHSSGGNTAPKLINNQLSIEEGQNVTLTANELSATDYESNDEDLIFTVGNVAHGVFQSKIDSHKTAMNFKQSNVTQGDIVFIHDGGEQPPFYTVFVSDGDLNNVDGAQAVHLIDFKTVNNAPLLINNKLTIYQGGRFFLANADLSATDEETLDEDLLFTVRNVEHGYFEKIDNPNNPLTFFSQQKIMGAQIQFIHDGSEIAPSYEVSVSDGELSAPFSSAMVNFIKTDSALFAQQNDSSGVRDKVIGGMSTGILGILYIFFKLYFDRKNQNTFKKLTASQKSSETQQSSDISNDVTRPIAKTIFERIKVTGFLNYIHEDAMKDYLKAVEEIVRELKSMDVNVNLSQMDVAEQSLLVVEIAKQTKKLLLPRYVCCSGYCGCYLYRFFRSVFVPDITASELKSHAKDIAIAVKERLYGRAALDRKKSIVDMLVTVSRKDKLPEGSVANEVDSKYELPEENVVNEVPQKNVANSPELKGELPKEDVKNNHVVIEMQPPQ